MVWRTGSRAFAILGQRVVGRKGEKEAGQLWLKKAGLANSAVGRPLPEGEVADRAKLGDQSVGEGKPYPDVVKRKLARTKTDGSGGNRDCQSTRRIWQRWPPHSQ